MKAYTGVGSRQTPDNICLLMETLAYKLAEKGWCLRSGAAEGADTAFENGWQKWADKNKRKNKGSAEIFLPWAGFNKREADKFHLLPVENDLEAYHMAEEMHPNWAACSAGAQTLHMRNIYQVLGQDLQSPSKMLICWAPQNGKEPKGGTRTAWVLAQKHNIACFNLANVAHYDRIKKFLED